LKIAIVVNPLIPVPPERYGGIERIVFMLIQELIGFGHDITLFAHPDSNPGCVLIPYRESENSSAFERIKINLLTAKIARTGFDMVHTFGRMSNIALLMFSGIPKIVSYQLFPTLSQVRKASKLARAKSLYFTACSNYIGDLIREDCDVTTIYNGVDPEEYQFNGSLDEHAPLVFLGRIQEEKGTAVAIRVAKETQRKLIIAGNIPGEAVHQKYFNEQVKPFIDNKQIFYVGPVNNMEKNKLLRGAFAFLMPVLWDEPFGIVMTEALACGVPIIGFKRGAVPEVVENGVNGFVVNSYSEMVKAVAQIESIDRRKCREIMEQKFSSAVIARQYEALYFRALNKL
jgi:glycosyltransferase involved in cell wall biosynthesis